MRQPLRRLAAIVALLALWVAAAPRATAVSEGLDAFITRQMQLAHVPGLAAGIVVDGELAWSRGYGWANVQRRVAATPDTLFMLASVSKTFTGTAVMQQVEAGRLDLDADVNRYLPFTVRNPRHRTPITIRQLLTHTASIQDDEGFLLDLYVRGDSPIPLGQFLRHYLDPAGRDYDPDLSYYRFAPGSRFEYSNTGYALLGYLVERAGGQPFDAYCRDRIFTPLAMPATSWRLRDLDASKVAMPYAFSGGRYRPYGHYGYPDYPNGLLRTSVRQLAHFVAAHLAGGRFQGRQILRPATVQAMHAVQRDDGYDGIGFAFFNDRSHGVALVGHDGGDAGVATEMWLSPSRGFGVIVLANGEADRPAEEQARARILARLLAEAAGL